MKRINKIALILQFFTILIPNSYLFAQVANPYQDWFNAVDSADTSRFYSMLDVGSANRRYSLNSPVDIENNLPLHLAASRCNQNMVNAILSRGAASGMNYALATATNKWNDTPLRIAEVKCGNTSAITNSIRMAANPNNIPNKASVGANIQTLTNNTNSANSANQNINSNNVVLIGQNISGNMNRCLERSWRNLSDDDARAGVYNTEGGVYKSGNTRYYVVKNICPQSIFVFSAACADETTLRPFSGDSWNPPYGINELVGNSVNIGHGFLRSGAQMVVSLEWNDEDPSVRHPHKLRLVNAVVGAFSESYWNGSGSMFTQKSNAFRNRLNLIARGVANNNSLGAFSLATPAVRRANNGNSSSCANANLEQVWNNN